MGDRVAVMKDGLLQQVDAPRVLYDSPVNSFVAGFIGSPAMNLIEGTIASDGITIGSTVLAVPRALQMASGAGPVTVGLRPEALELVGEGAGIPAVVNLVEELGSEAYVYCQLADNAKDAITAAPDVIVRVDPHGAPDSGDKIELHVKEDSMLLFDFESGARITGT